MSWRREELPAGCMWPGVAEVDGRLLVSCAEPRPPHRFLLLGGGRILLPSVRRYLEPGCAYLGLFVVEAGDTGAVRCVSPPLFDDGFNGGSVDQWSLSSRPKNR